MSDERSSANTLAVSENMIVDSFVLDSPQSDDQDRLKRLKEELFGLPLAEALEKLMARFDLTINQVAESAGIDESAFRKILKGEHREFNTDHVDKLLYDLSDPDREQRKLTNAAETAIWHEALSIASLEHYVDYKALAPRIWKKTQDSDRQAEFEAVLADELRSAFAKAYRKLGRELPLILPVDLVARRLFKKWDWIKVPPGYELLEVESDDSYLILHDLTHDVDAGLRAPEGSKLEYVGYRKWRVRRVAPAPPQTLPEQTKPPPEPSQPNRRPARRTARFIEPEMVRVPEGKFWMGSDDTDKDASSDEKPRHRVNLRYDFWIGRYTVTNEEYRLFLLDDWNRKAPSGWQGRDFPNGKAKHPVVNVSWRDALAYCLWLSQLTGQPYKLPSEAEWEKAARGTDGRKYPWGPHEPDKSLCNFDGNEGGTTPVGKYSPQGDSPYECSDMAGNVGEWTRSLWGKDWNTPEFKYPYDPQDKRSENLNAPDEVRRVVRGGSWLDIRRDSRAAVRLRFDPAYFLNHLGFRVGRSPVLRS